MITINIKLKNIENATNEFNDKILNSNLDNYILENSKHIKKKEKIFLTISNISNKKEQIDLTNLIHSHYLNKVIQLKKQTIMMITLDYYFFY